MLSLFVREEMKAIYGWAPLEYASPFEVQDGSSQRPCLSICPSQLCGGDHPETEGEQLLSNLYV